MASEIDMSTLDITRQNAAVEKVLEHTDNPRHRYLLQAYLRHRYLESAGRWEEILDPSLTVDVPHYRFNVVGQEPFTVTGKDQVGMLYGHWTATNQCIFYVSDEQVLEPDARQALPGGERRVVHGEAHRLPIALGHHGIGDRVLAEQRPGQQLLAAGDLLRRALVLGQCRDQGEQQRDVVGHRTADRHRPRGSRS